MDEEAQYINNYLKDRNKKRMYLALFIVVAAILSVVTIGINRYTDLNFVGCFRTLIDHILGNPSALGNDDFVVWDRLVPRSIMAICVGCALAAGGAVMQIIMRNPLADPYTTGISSGAGLGATLWIVLGITIIPGLTDFASMVVNSFLFSLIPAAIIIFISQFRKTSPEHMILIGVGVMYLFSAVNTVVMLMADPTNLQGAYLWTMGNLGNAEWPHIPLVVSATALGCLALYTFSSKLNVISTGEKTSKSLGEDPNTIRRVCLVITSLMVAVVVSFSGTIGFVGIIAPHVARLFLGSNSKMVIPASMALGAIIMLLADSVAKLLILPIGVITSVVGGPLFLIILLRMRRSSGAYA